MGTGRPRAAEAQVILERRMNILALRRDGYTIAAIAEATEATLNRVNNDIRWLREQGYDLGEAVSANRLITPGARIGQLRAVAAADDEAAERREVNDRRIRGEGILEISIAMRIGAAEVRRHISEAARIAREGDIEERRELELARLDRLLQKLEEGIQEGSPKSINAAARVIAERCKLLGLYRPMQIEHTVITVDMIDAEMQRLNAELGRLKDGIIEGQAVEVRELTE